jgi:hypothetical protein
MQTSLRIRSEQHVTLAEVVIKLDETQPENVNKTDTVSYASKVKVGIENQSQAVAIVMDVQDYIPIIVTNDSDL